jgi:folate/biopterin transporter
MTNSQYNENEVIKRRNKLAYLLIAFHQGVSYISKLAVQYFFKDELKIEPHILAQINSFTELPWAIKPLLGMLTDFFPICGYRRKVYIILCGLINLLCWMTMATFTHTTFVACITIFMVNLTLSFCSVLGEAVVVELSQLETTNKDSKAKDLVSLFFLSRTVGELISAYLKGLFVDIMTLRHIFLIACFIPTMLIISGFMLIEKRQVDDGDSYNSNRSNRARNVGNNLDEERPILGGENISQSYNNNNNNYGSTSRRGEEARTNMDDNSNGRNSPGRRRGHNRVSMKDLFAFLCQKQILLPLSFIIVFKMGPSYQDAFFYFITNELKLNATALGKISFASTVAILIAILIYKAYLKRCNFKTMIIIGTIISFIISLSCYLLVLRINLDLGISDFTVLLFANSFLSMVGEFVLLPILSLACILCPKNMEGTVYSFFMSSLNLGGILSSVNGGIVTSMLGISSTNYDNLHWLILISKISSLLPLPMLLCIDEKYLNPELEREEEPETEEKVNLEVVKKEEKEEIKNQGVSCCP